MAVSVGSYLIGGGRAKMLLRSIRSRLLALVIATVSPFIALVGVGLWSQWRDDQSAAIQRAYSEAQLLAAQVDDHISNIENLLAGLSRAVSTNPVDVSANDVLLRQVRLKLPELVNNILFFTPDGTNIGKSLSTASIPNAGDRAYFQKILAGERFSIGEVVRARRSGQFIVTVGYPVEDQEGRLQGVLAMGTKLERFQDALRIDRLPAGSVVRIVNEQGIVVARNLDGPNWIGRDLGKSENVVRHIAAKEASEFAVWSDDVERITGSSTAHRVPWLVSVGLPTDTALATVYWRLGWGALFAIITLTTAFALAWMISLRIIRPLRQLRNDASVLAGGNLGHRTQVQTDDEVGNLADALNRMAVSLERRQDEVLQSKNTLAAVIDASPVSIVCSDLDRRIMLWNRAAERLFGYTAKEAVGTTVMIVPPEERTNSLGLYQRARNGESIRDLQVKRRRKDCTMVDVRIAAAPLLNPDGTIRGVAWAHEDITEAKRADEQLNRLAHYDPLTGLPNRLSLQKELGKLLVGDGSDDPAAIALFDLDGFKEVNDTLGHPTGDKLLIEVGRRLIEAAGSRGGAGQVFRLGGDEFVIIIPNCGDPCVVGDIVEQALRRLKEPIMIDDQALHIGGSAGVAISPTDGLNVDVLIANADLALYQAKSDGGQKCRFFMPVLRAQAQARRGLDVELRRANAESEFELYFQPQIRLADKAVVGAEALLRWRHPERGILAPRAFIKALAESSIAPDIGRWIIGTACERASAWRAMGLPIGRICVNLFPVQLYGETLLKDIEEALQQTCLPPEVLEVEITETVALNCEEAIVRLRRLHQKGIKITFDDFGTGYASLSNLTRFPLSRIKIDQSFVFNLAESAESDAIVRSLIAMAHNLGLEVIAEGVETDTQEAFLINERCEEAQGYLYAHPLPAAEFEAYLRAKQIREWNPVRERVFHA